LGLEEQWRDGDLPTEGPRRFGRRNSGEMLEPGPEPVANASPPQVQVRQGSPQSASRVPRNLWGNCGGHEYPAIACPMQQDACQGMSLRTPGPGRAIARVSLSMSQSGLFSACFPAGKGVGRAAERSRYFEELGRDKVGLASGWTDVPTAAF
jgi:hypothetical protein